MKRTFYGIGQGAFYCETFEKDNKKLQVIYDCGSFDKDRLVSEIRNLDSNCPTILFISHFHLDHINGLPILLKMVNEKRLNLKHIFFPYLTPNDRILLICYNYYLQKFEKSIGKTISDNSFVFDFINNPWKAVSQITTTLEVELTCITPYHNHNRLKTSHLQFGEWQTTNCMNSGKININNNFNWIFYSYNLNKGFKKHLLKRKLYQTFGKKISLRELNHIYIDDDNSRRKIDTIFKSLGEINTNSLILLSIGKTISLAGKPQFLLKPLEYACISSGFLYLGDFNAKKYMPYINNILKLKKIDKNIGIQIPHHGSKHSFNNKLLEKCKYCIISANPKNYYHHPHKIVIQAVKKNNIPYQVVNNKTMNLCFSNYGG